MIYRIVYWITDKHLQFTIALIYMKDFQYILTRKYALQQLVSIWMKKKKQQVIPTISSKITLFICGEWMMMRFNRCHADYATKLFIH